LERSAGARILLILPIGINFGMFINLCPLVWQ
jgi:hypothetical protein